MLMPCVKFLLLLAAVGGILLGMGFLLIHFWWVFLLVLAVWIANTLTTADTKPSNNNTMGEGGE